MVKYVYDAWGNGKTLSYDGSELTSTSHIGCLNPIRYRGYYYDVETKLYYLKTRYYDPETGRFITIDDLSYLDPEHINGLNLYAYCGNNPVMAVDPGGTKPKWLKWLLFGLSIVVTLACFAIGAVLVATGVAAPIGFMLIGAGIGGAIGIVGSIFSQGISNGWGNIDYGQVGIDGLFGALTGALIASPLGPVATGFAVGFAEFGHSVATDLYQNDGDWSKVNWGKAALTGVIVGAVSGVGKYFAVSKDMKYKFVNGSQRVQELSTASARLGLEGRATYTSLWKHFIVRQKIYNYGTKLIPALIRTALKSFINLLW